MTDFAWGVRIRLFQIVTEVIEIRLSDILEKTLFFGMQWILNLFCKYINEKGILNGSMTVACRTIARGQLLAMTSSASKCPYEQLPGSPLNCRSAANIRYFIFVVILIKCLIIWTNITEYTLFETARFSFFPTKNETMQFTFFFFVCISFLKVALDWLERQKDWEFF